MRKIIACGRFLSVFAYTVCCLFLISFVFPRSGLEKKGRIIKAWAARLIDWLGIRIVVKGLENVASPSAQSCGVTPGEKGRLVVSNHVSFLDIFTLDAVLPSGFVAKAEIAKWPVFGRIAKAVGTIFIERGNKRALLGIGASMKSAIEAGRTLLMFPEGTTSDGTGLLKLHANLFDAAAKTGANVIPVVLRYKSRGEITTAPAYVGDTGLFECLWSVVNTPDLTVEVIVGQPFTGEDRHSLCKQASAVMSRAIGVEDPLAEKTLPSPEAASKAAESAAAVPEAAHV